MQEIIYYVATSLDGYISGPGGDISRFAQTGAAVDRYRADLEAFRTTIMGRRTYEFGYRYGLQPGRAAYPRMQHHIFSDHLRFADADPSVHVEPLRLDRIRELRRQSPTPIYLCGGGRFAGWLLDHGQIDRLKLKLNPIVLGGGVPLFGDSTTAANWELTERESFADGLQFLTYRIAD